MFRAFRNELFKVFSAKRIHTLTLVMLTASTVMALILKKLSTLEDAKNVVLNAPSYPITFFTQIGAVIFPLLIVIAVGGLMSDEYRDGTLKLALLAPVTRMELLGAKVATVITANAFILFVTMAGSYGISLALFGWSEEFILDGRVFALKDGILLVIEFFCTLLIPAAAFGILVLLFSQLINNSGIVVGLSSGIYFIQLFLQNMVPELRHHLITSYFSYGYVIAGPDKGKFLLAMLPVCGVYVTVSMLIMAIHLQRKDL